MTQNEVMPMDTLAKIYIKMRSKKNELTRAYDKQVAEIETQQALITNAMKDQMMASGSKTVRTDYGTVILTTKTKFWTSDWDSFKSFIVEYNAVDLLERRIAQKNTAEFLEANPGVVPPGLNQESEYVIAVRKPT